MLGMNRQTGAAITLGLLAVFFAVDVAEAKWRLSRFSGSRSQVRHACVGEGREMSDGFDRNGVGYTMCIDTINNTGVVCGSEGSCVGSYGFRVAKPRVPRGTFDNKGSLSTPNEGTPGTASPTRGPVIIN